MKSYNLNENKIKIHLNTDEIEMLFGSYDMIDYDSPRSRAIIDSLICSAMPQKEDANTCDKVLIEVVPERDGCSIQVTRIYDKGRCLQKNLCKREYILLFDNSEDLIDYIGSLKPIQISLIIYDSLYRVFGRYALYISIDKNYNIDNAGEYCKVLDIKSPEGSFVLEHGKLLYHEASEKIYKAFKKHNKTP